MILFFRESSTKGLIIVIYFLIFTIPWNKKYIWFDDESKKSMISFRKYTSNHINCDGGQIFLKAVTTLLLHSKDMILYNFSIDRHALRSKIKNQINLNLSFNHTFENIAGINGKQVHR